ATNAAMVLAKPAKMNPRDIAALLVEKLAGLDHVTSAEIAGPGFINMRIDSEFWHARLGDVLGAATSYGDSKFGAGEGVNVEYVSANPTGPMHVGHARGAVFGDALAALLEKAGFDVTREYYINDAGTQVGVLARSLHLRYREALGEDIGAIPEGLYPGDYLIPVGKDLAEKDGDKWQNIPEDDWLVPFQTLAVDAMMELIKGDLAELGVKFDMFTSEHGLVEAGKVDSVLKFLEDRGLIYQGVLEPPKGKKPDDWEERPQTLFKATDFGDDVDRPLKKSDGTWTYFASDIAYHLDKYQRGFKTMIDVWGADHGGYVKRMEAAVKAVTEGDGELDVKVCRLVNLLEDGKPAKMSKRAGTFVTLRDVVEQVGKDVVRFIMLTRTNDKTLDFDFARVTEQSRDNPVFYVQYAHARICSVMRHAADEFGTDAITAHALSSVALDKLTDSDELALIKTMAAWPRMVESAALAHEPHRIAFYLNDLASGFHGLWNKGKDNAHLRFIIADDPDVTKARLALLQGVAFVIASGLQVFGVTPVQEM
ncbi:MAG: arginine--tRNA ligase, partial [Rhodospirillales bacterium]|nr:arginine--tRNA ligase [Rhodospirillales bacterium]